MNSPTSKTIEESALTVLQSLMNDTGLVQLMRPDQVRRGAAVIERAALAPAEKLSYTMAEAVALAYERGFQAGLTSATK